MQAIDNIEECIENFINRHVEKISALDADSYFKEREPRIEDPRAQFVTNSYYNIHGNISALLTHISAMIAALGIILIVFDDSKLTQVFIFIEIIIYTIIAIVCVYCLRLRGSVPKSEPVENNNYLKYYYRTYSNRRYLYYLCSTGVLINTIFFLFTILFHILALAIFN